MPRLLPPSFPPKFGADPPRFLAESSPTQRSSAAAQLTLRPQARGEEIRWNLLKWFARHKRNLPWRVHGNPYRIFVVEVMLQQTQIKTVIPYYERWMKTFPNIEALARSPLDQVLKLWEGLGYYTRARNLHRAAQIIVDRFGGKIPSDPEILQTLPGIGRYTAGAVASIAFQKPVPLVDGNVARVLSRIYNLKKDVSKPETQKFLYAIAQKLVPPSPLSSAPFRQRRIRLRRTGGRGNGEGKAKRPGDFNQALMELGSLICIPEIPKCSICPVRSLCLAFQKGDPSRLPIRSKGPEVKKIDMVVGLLRKNGKILVRRRPPRGIWGGLWEIPGTVCLKNQSSEAALAEEFKEGLGLSVTAEKKWSKLKHRFTHRLAFIHPFELKMSGNGKRQRNSAKTLWASPAKLKTLSFPVPHQKILKSIIPHGF
ncbi:MAG: A/G-specific adenine glycosylase [Candidatus Omnitrophica bacterium]|nr:A/G-specific adenine glycosylase [Candidatus Omnitrophota bacterium]